MSNKGEKQQGGVSALDFFCIGFGSIVGVGWALSINRWMANSGGALPAAVGYLVVLIMMVPVSLCYCELAPMMPVAGGGTAYAYRAFNEKVAFISGWAIFGGSVTIIPWEAIYVCDVLSILFPGLKGGAPLYTLQGSDIYLGHIVVGTICSCLIFFINWKGATSSALFQRIITLVLVGSGILGMIAALGKFDIQNLQPFYETIYNADGSARGTHTNFMGGVIAIILSAPFFLAGFETIPQAVEDAKGDIASVGKTVVLSVSLACIFYALLLFCFGSAMPWKDFWAGGEFGSPAGSLMFRVIYDNALGTVMYYIILIGTVCGLFSTWNGFMMASPRILMGLARGYMLPRGLAKQNKHGTPTNGLIACFVLSLAGPFLGMGLVDPLTTFSGTAFVTSWMLTSFSLVKLRKSEPNAERPYKIPGGSATGMFASIVMTLVLLLLLIPFPGNPAFMGNQPLLLFVCWMVLGFALYFSCAGQRNSVSKEERTKAIFDKH